MFALFKKDPVKKLQQQYEAKLEEAMKAQRNGDIDGYSSLSVEANDLLEALNKAKEEQAQ